MLLLSCIGTFPNILIQEEEKILTSFSPSLGPLDYIIIIIIFAQEVEEGYFHLLHSIEYIRLNIFPGRMKRGNPFAGFNLNSSRRYRESFR